MLLGVRRWFWLGAVWDTKRVHDLIHGPLRRRVRQLVAWVNVFWLLRAKDKTNGKERDQKRCGATFHGSTPVPESELGLV